MQDTIKKMLIMSIFVFIFLSGCDEDEFINGVYAKTSNNEIIQPIKGQLNPSFNGKGYVIDKNIIAVSNPFTGLAGTSIAFKKDKNSVVKSIYILGNRQIGSYYHMTIWKYTSKGELDTSFGDPDNTKSLGQKLGFVTYKNGIGNTMVLDDSGNIYVAGSVFNTRLSMTIWKYTSKGELDTSFGDPDNTKSLGQKLGFATYVNNASNNHGSAMVLDDSGNIYVAGFIEKNDFYMTIWKYDSNGDLDTTFGSGNGFVTTQHQSSIDDVGYGIALDNSGNIYVAGNIDDKVSNSMTIWKYDSNGDLDTTFGSGNGFVKSNIPKVSSIGRAIALDGSGNIYVTGWCIDNNNAKMTIWKYNNNGKLYDNNLSVNNAFGDSGKGFLFHNSKAFEVGNAIALEKDKNGATKNIYVAGSVIIDINKNLSNMIIWKYNKNGKLDTTFGDSNNLGEKKGFVKYVDKQKRSNQGKAIVLEKYKNGATKNIYVAGSVTDISKNLSNMIIWSYK